MVGGSSGGGVQNIYIIYQGKRERGGRERERERECMSMFFYVCVLCGRKIESKVWRKMWRNSAGADW